MNVNEISTYKCMQKPNEKAPLTIDACFKVELPAILNTIGILKQQSQRKTRKHIYN